MSTASTDTSRCHGVAAGPAWAAQQAPPPQQQQQQLAQQAAHEAGDQSAKAGTHSWIMGCFLLVNGVCAPALLAQPYAFAVLGWAGGVSINMAMAVASWYCMYHQALLFHTPAGARHVTYKRMGLAILGPHMGRWGGRLIAALQHFINVGSAITNMILTGQLLQSIYMTLCTVTGRCAFTASTSAWIGLGGLLSYAVYMGLPSLSTVAWAGIAGAVACVYYSVAAMVMAGIDGDASHASYALSGPPGGLLLSAFNGVGILLFLYGITVLPEVQAVLADDPVTGDSTRPMVWAATGAHFVFVPLYLLVGIIGYWAYGADVNAFLLFANTQPAWLVVSAEIAAALQLQLVTQVLIVPTFEAAERLLLRFVGHVSCCTRSSSGRGSSKAAAAMGARATPSVDAACIAEDGPSVAESPVASPTPHAARPSLLLMFASRTAISAAMLLCACALPFFGGVMGFVGAVGFGPLTYILPTVMFMVAHPQQPRTTWWFNVGFILFWLCASALGAVGSMASIVSTASSYSFFSR